LGQASTAEPGLEKKKKKKVFEGKGGWWGLMSKTLRPSGGGEKRVQKKRKGVKKNGPQGGKSGPINIKEGVQLKVLAHQGERETKNKTEKQPKRGTQNEAKKNRKGDKRDGKLRTPDFLTIRVGKNTTAGRGKLSINGQSHGQSKKA